MRSEFGKKLFPVPESRGAETDLTPRQRSQVTYSLLKARCVRGARLCTLTTRTAAAACREIHLPY